MKGFDIDLTGDVREKLDEVPERGARRLRDILRDEVPVVTGRLRDSIEVQRAGADDASVRISAPYAARVNRRRKFVEAALARLDVADLRGEER